MTRLLCVGDGPRDEKPLPALLKNLLGRSLRCDYEDWRAQRRNVRGPIGPGRGFGKKVAEALLKARRGGYDGLVCVLDQDTAPKGARLAQARRGREKDRSDLSRVPLPAALGEARPHFEAWLLDDGEAVKAVLRIDPTEAVVAVEKCGSPKLELERLIADRGLERDPTKAEVAAAVTADRCRAAKGTGFAEFVAELQTEFGLTST